MTNDIFTPSCTFGDNFEKLEHQIYKMGFDGVLYSFYPKPMYINSDIQPVLHFSESFNPFVGHYLKNNYGNSDFILRLALMGRRKPIDWWEEINLGNVTEKEMLVTLDAKENFGIHHGLSIPVLFGTFAIAGISVICKNPSIDFYCELKERSMDDLRECANQYHSKVIKYKEELHFFIFPLLEKLNESKKKVLRHLMSGKPMKMIEHQHDITPRYAEKVLINLRQEFGDISTNELIYILGMVNMHEYL